MSPVHVIVGEDQRAEAMWASAFTGAVDLYRFPRNVDAFERLTAAEAPIDLVVLTPAQRGPFNLTPDQFVARLLEGPLGSSRFLANLHVIVVGQPLERSHPRVMAVSTLDAAIRLVKFGEIERAPRPQAPTATVGQRPTTAGTPVGADPVDAIIGDGIAGSIISRIWDAPRAQDRVEEPAPKPRRDEVIGGGDRTPAAGRPAARPVEHADIAQPSENPQLFARAVATGFIATAPGAPEALPPAAEFAPHHQVVGGGAAPAPVAVPGESIEVATGGLQPARPYQLPNGGGYRGPAVRAGQVNPASHETMAGGQPVPPALASQVQSMVYGGMVGNPSDPLLTWSSGARAAAAPVPEQQVAAAPASVPMATPIAQPQAPLAVRTLPMEPPAGVYGAAPAPMAAPSDPFLARAEQAGGAVSFG